MVNFRINLRPLFKTEIRPAIRCSYYLQFLTPDLKTILNFFLDIVPLQLKTVI